VADSMRFCLIEPVESRRPFAQESPDTGGRQDVAAHGPRHQTVAPPNVHRDGRPDHSTYRALPLFQGNPCARNAATAVTRFTVQSSALVARLRPTKCNDRFEVLYWSLWKNRWTSTGPLGRTVLSIKGALGFIAYEDIFWVMT
jgi:hypothetical protein